MRALLASLLLMTALLAGCSDGGGDGDGSETSSSSSSTGSSATSSTGTKSQTATSTSSTGTGGPQNGAPTGTVAATVVGAVAAFALTGSDPDGDALTWTLSFGDGSSPATGSTLPSGVNHTYADGNYTAFYNVTDGKATATYNVTVVVAAPSGGTSLTFSGDVANYCSFCTEALGQQDGSEPASPFPSVSWASGDQGIDAIWVQVPAGLIGHAWSATTTGVDVAVASFTACGPQGHFIEMVDTGAVPETGVVPAGTGCMVLWEYLSFLPPPLGTPSDPTGGEQTLGLTIV